MPVIYETWLCHNNQYFTSMRSTIEIRINMTPPHKSTESSEIIKEFKGIINNSLESESNEFFYRCEFCVMGFSNVSSFMEHFDDSAWGCLGQVCAYFSFKQIINNRHPLAFRCVFDDCGLCIKKSKDYQKEFHRHLKSHGMDLVILYTKTRLKENVQT
ncbi:MAG: hypothetical protein HW420_998 [Candidatus Nitrosotenuis sp.]|nr:hypothetical protein [Candidatus Nitrosotenuis sp.]